MFELTVYGAPGPQGSKKHVGNGVMIESSKKVKPWRKAIVEAVMEQYPNFETLEGPLTATIVFTMPKPKSAPKRKITYPEKRPDVDKLLRSTFDGLTQAKVWGDDSQPVTVLTGKRYPNEGEYALSKPGVYIFISRKVYVV